MAQVQLGIRVQTRNTKRKVFLDGYVCRLTIHKAYSLTGCEGVGCGYRVREMG